MGCCCVDPSRSCWSCFYAWDRIYLSHVKMFSDYVASLEILGRRTKANGRDVILQPTKGAYIRLTTGIVDTYRFSFPRSPSHPWQHLIVSLATSPILRGYLTIAVIYSFPTRAPRHLSSGIVRSYVRSTHKKSYGPPP